MRDGKQDWTPSALAANANMFLDDFLLFDVAKPITDASHLEIEKSTLNGRAYQTGGGRTVDADVIDILLTWMVNRDREFLEGGTTKATKPGTKSFPYFAAPNMELQTRGGDRRAQRNARQGLGADRAVRRRHWHPLIANIRLTGTGLGQLRTIETIDGKQIIERLDAIDNAARSYRYANIGGIAGLQLHRHASMSSRKVPAARSSGARSFLPNGQGTLIVRTIVSTLFKTGLESLKSRFWRCAMIDLDSECPPTTDGEIAVVNLQSARLRSWSRFFQDPLQPGVAEILIEQEQFTAQFVGDLSALDRVESLTRQLVQLDAGSARTALIQAQIASMLHRFSDARHYLAQAELGGAPSADDVKRLRLSIDQACGLDLDAVMDERRKIAAKSGRLEDLVALGALLADLREFSEADRHLPAGAAQLLRRFAVRRGVGLLSARVCCGASLRPNRIWPLPSSGIAKAIACLPGYVKARVHLAEICSGDGRTGEAEDLLVPALASGDPEVRWRLADVLAARRKAPRGRCATGCRAIGVRGASGAGTCWHSPIMARNSTPAAAAMLCGPSNSPASMSTIAQRCAPLSKPMKSPLRPVRPAPPLRLLQHAPIGGDTLRRSGCRLSHNIAWTIGRELPHDDRSARFCRWHGAPRRCSRFRLLPLDAAANVGRRAIAGSHDRWLERGRTTAILAIRSGSKSVTDGARLGANWSGSR